MAGQTIPDFYPKLYQCSVMSCRRTDYCVYLNGAWVCSLCLSNAQAALYQFALRDKTAASRGELCPPRGHQLAETTSRT